MCGIRRVLDVDIAGVVGQGRPRLKWRKEKERRKGFVEDRVAI